MSNVHNLDFGGVELGSCEALLARNFQRKRRAYQRTHGDCFLVFGKLVMVGGGIFAVGWCGFSLESLNSFWLKVGPTQSHNFSGREPYQLGPVTLSPIRRRFAKQPKMGPEQARGKFPPGNDHSIFHYAIRY